MARTNLTTGQDTVNRSVYTTDSITPHAHRLVLAFVMNVNQGNGLAAEPTVSGNNLAWALVASAQCGGSGDYRLTCFRAVGAAPSAGPVSCSFALDGQAQVQDSCAWSVFEYDLSGADGSRAIVHSRLITSGGNDVSTIGLALNPLEDAVRHVCVGGAIAALPPAAGGLAQGAGLTEIHTQIVPGGRPGTLDTQDRTGGGTAVGWSVPAAAPACAIALEIRTTLDVESLARRFAPILYCHRAEKFFPSDAKRYVEHTALWRSVHPIFAKSSWSQSIPKGGIGALPGEQGTFLGTQVTHPPSETRFLELTGWKNKAGALEPGVTPTSENVYSHRAGLDDLYNKDDAAGGNRVLRDSRFWYHAEGFDTDRLRRLLATVSAPDLVKVLDSPSVKNPVLLCFYFFFPAHEESLADPCTNVEAREFGSFAGEWACAALLLERDSEAVPFTPTFIGYSGRPLPPAGVAQSASGRDNMKVSPFAAAEHLGHHAKLFLALGTHSLYPESGPQGEHAVGDFTSIFPQNCGRKEGVLPILSDVEDFFEGAGLVLLKGLIGSGNFPGLGLIAGVWWALVEADDPESTPVYDKPAPDQGPFPGNLGKVLHPPGVTIDDQGAQPEPWTSAQNHRVDGRQYDFVVDRGAQVWWPGDTPTTGFEGGPGYRGLWGPPVTGDYNRRSGMVFPDFWKSFFLALADGKAKNLF